MYDDGVCIAGKKNPKQDLAHLGYGNTEPLVEGEAPLIRTGSDGCIPHSMDDSSQVRVHTCT